MLRKLWFSWLLWVPLALSSVCGCSSAQSSKPTGGETHFLRACRANSDDCGSALTCQCGVCTRPCEKADECAAFPNAVCVPSDEANQCSAPNDQPHCDQRCDDTADCRSLSSEHVCVQGLCRLGSPIDEPDALASSAVDAAPAAVDAASSAVDAASAVDASVCSRGDVPGNALVLLGDSFFAVGHRVAAYLESLARASGALPDSDRYRDNSLLTANALALVSPGIAEQYGSAQAESPVRVVVMNGGGADLLLGNCETLGPDCPLLVNAAAAAGALFEQMAADGVTAVVYAFYPDPLEESVRAKVDALRPLIQAACASSPVTCHWLDLRDAFAGNDTEFLAANGLDPSAQGAEATAKAIWSVMQSNCIAQ